MHLSRFVVVYEKVAEDENVLYDVVDDRYVGVDDASLAALRRWGAGGSPEDAEEESLAQVLAAQGFLVEGREADDRRLAGYRAKAAGGMEGTMYVVLMPTLACNLACTYCFQKESPAFNRMDADTEAASVEFILRKVDEAGTPKLVVQYVGGEVLTRKDFVLRTAEAFAAAMATRGGTFAWHLTTNGIGLDLPFVEALNRCGEGSVKITLDGDKETHDAARVYRNGKGSFDLVFDGLTQIAGATRVWVGGNFFPGQEASYERLVDRIVDAGIGPKLEMLRFKPVIDAASEAGPGCTSCAASPKEEADTLIRLDRLVRRKGKGQVKSATIDSLRGPCELHWDNNYVIDPDGLVYRCPAVAGRSEVAVGSVKSASLRGAPLLEAKPWEKHAPCHDCAFLPVCMGGCIGGQYLKTGRPDQVLCKKEWFEESFRELVPRRYLDELGAAPWDGDHENAGHSSPTVITTGPIPAPSPALAASERSEA